MTKEDKVKSKTKKSKDNVKDVDGEKDAIPYEVRMQAVTVISKPMASQKQVIHHQSRSYEEICANCRAHRSAGRYHLLVGASAPEVEGGRCERIELNPLPPPYKS